MGYFIGSALACEKAEPNNERTRLQFGHQIVTYLCFIGYMLECNYIQHITFVYFYILYIVFSIFEV